MDILHKQAWVRGILSAVFWSVPGTTPLLQHFMGKSLDMTFFIKSTARITYEDSGSTFLLLSHFITYFLPMTDDIQLYTHLPSRSAEKHRFYCPTLILKSI